MENSAIERIAAPDLATDALALLKEYRDNDDVIFFLGRLVWQGEMASCAPALFDIAADTLRGKYARIAAIRGVMAVGDDALTDSLWKTIAADPGRRPGSQQKSALLQHARSPTRHACAPLPPS